jgi:lipid II:glycine glycyltransferase (peptidoglycan interpeptide bridge formation enzyme)
MKIEKVDQDKWDQIATSFSNHSFLNSKARHLHNLDNKVYSDAFLVKEGENCLAFVNYHIQDSKWGNYLYCQNSPLLKDAISEEKLNKIFNLINEELKKRARDHKCFLARISPFVKKGSQNSYEIVKSSIQNCKTRLIEAPTPPIDALISQYIPLDRSEDKILKDMRSSTRYNIRKTGRAKHLEVKATHGKEDLDTFIKLHEQTRELKGYIGKPLDKLKDELELYAKHDMLYTLTGYYEDKPIGSWILLRYGNLLSNYQAGLDTKFRKKNVRINYLLFWEAVKLGKKEGIQYLDLFGGMKPEDCSDKHPWSGISNFKQGFGGKTVSYIHPRDIVIKPILYWPNYIFNTLRYKRRGYCLKW